MNLGPSSMSRRAWLLGSLALSALGAAPLQGNPRLDAIRARGRKTGMEGFDESETTNYVGIGDAPTQFRDDALGICEAVAAEYRKHFTDKGFELSWPKEKLTVVILMGPKSYAMFEGGFIDEALGHFDLNENRLVIFDFRGPGSNRTDAVREQDNTLQLVHETVHQLTFNTGLLDLKADIPLCVTEGLATYGETWRPLRKGQIGSRNVRRVLGLSASPGVKWIPLTTLLADDKLFDDQKTVQIAYAESWMFVYKMLKEPARTAKLRAYLSALREKPDPTKRLEIATTHLGDLNKLDKDIRTVR
jgi:hypothetical protein